MNALAQGSRVLITRPLAQAQALEDLLRRAGLHPVTLPLFQIEPAGRPEAQRVMLAEHRADAGWLFTSTNAVQAAAALDRGPWPASYAIGGATARALARLQRGEVCQPLAGSTSEDLLSHPALQTVRGARFLLCTGQGGREVLAETLQRRGAAVERLVLYQRVPVDHAEAAVGHAVETAAAVICTSGESLQRLCALTPSASQDALRRCVLVVPSPRVLELARRLGFDDVRAPAAMSDEALVGCLSAPR